MSDIGIDTRAEYGRAAARAGALDGESEEPVADLMADALANMMHAAHEDGVDFRLLLERAALHFEHEQHEQDETNRETI